MAPNPVANDHLLSAPDEKKDTASDKNKELETTQHHQQAENDGIKNSRSQYQCQGEENEVVKPEKPVQKIYLSAVFAKVEKETAEMDKATLEARFPWTSKFMKQDSYL